MANVLALLSSLSWGVADYVGGRVSRRVSAVVVVLWSQMVGLAVALVGAPLFDGSLDLQTVAVGAAAGLGGGLGLAALYRGFAIGSIAVVAPVAAVVSVIIPVVVGVVDGERPTMPATVGIVLALPALWLVSGGDLRSTVTGSTSARLGIAAGIGFGMFLVLLGLVPLDRGLWPLVPARFASVSLMATLLFVRRRHPGVSLRDAPSLVFAGAGDMLANMLFLSAAQRGLLSVVSVLSSLYPAVTVVLARSMGESVAGRQWAGLGLASVAVAMIAA